jgi:hypothetical protein
LLQRQFGETSEEMQETGKGIAGNQHFIFKIK